MVLLSLSIYTLIRFKLKSNGETRMLKFYHFLPFVQFCDMMQAPQLIGDFSYLWDYLQFSLFICEKGLRQCMECSCLKTTTSHRPPQNRKEKKDQ